MTQGSASVAVGNDARADSAGPGNLAVAVGNPGYNPAYNGVVPTHALTDGSGNVAFAIGDGTMTGPVRLTKRETEIIKLLDVGMSNREIGEKLFISRHTVKIHVQNILAKLDVDSRAKAAACYRAGNCVTPKEKDVSPKEKDQKGRNMTSYPQALTKLIDERYAISNRNAAHIGEEFSSSPPTKRTPSRRIGSTFPAAT